MMMFLMDVLAAAYRNDDLKFVAIDQSLGGKSAARHDIPVPFKGYTFICQS